MKKQKRNMNTTHLRRDVVRPEVVRPEVVRPEVVRPATGKLRQVNDMQLLAISEHSIIWELGI
jgi:hypothetical protein